MSDNKNKTPDEVQPDKLLHPDDFSVDEDFSFPASEPTIDNEPLPTEEELTYTSRKENRSVPKKKNGSGKGGFRVKYVLIPAVSLAALTGLYLSVPFITANGIIPDNVKAGTVSIGGLTVAEAESRLENSTLPGLSDFSVTFTKNGKKVISSFTGDEIEISINPTKTAKAAYEYYHSGNPFVNSWHAIKTVFSEVDLGATYNYNEEKLSDIFYQLGAKIHGLSEAAEWKVEDDTLILTPSTPGQSHDVSLAIEEFFESVEKGVFESIPVTLKNNDSDLLDADEIYKEIFSEPKNAEYKIEGKKLTITDHVMGVDVDKAKLEAAVDRVNKGDETSIKLTLTEPEITNEKLQKSLFGATLATFSSSYASSSANRAYNVELAANKVNGVILADGEEFSYNKVVGNANAANGFKMATVYSGGKVTEGVGGGVCQVSSTLYCSVLRADLEVTERHNHSLPIAYVPGGQDATVAYGILDFKFKNNTGAPIKLVATYSGRQLTVSILGAESAKKKVEVTSQKVSSVSPTVTEVPDPNLPVGQTKVISKGAYGSVYTVYKKVYDKSGAVVSESKTTSRYKATPQEVAVGTKPLEETQTTPEAEATLSPETGADVKTPDSSEAKTPEKEQEKKPEASGEKPAEQEKKSEPEKTTDTQPVTEENPISIEE